MPGGSCPLILELRQQHFPNGPNQESILHASFASKPSCGGVNQVDVAVTSVWCLGLHLTPSLHPMAWIFSYGMDIQFAPHGMDILILPGRSMSVQLEDICGDVVSHIIVPNILQAPDGCLWGVAPHTPSVLAIHT